MMMINGQKSNHCFNSVFLGWNGLIYSIFFHPSFKMIIFFVDKSKFEENIQIFVWFLGLKILATHNWPRKDQFNPRTRKNEKKIQTNKQTNIGNDKPLLIFTPHTQKHYHHYHHWYPESESESVTSFIMIFWILSFHSFRCSVCCKMLLLLLLIFHYYLKKICS